MTLYATEICNFKIFSLAEHKTETAAIADLQAIIKAVSSELGDKVPELQRQDKLIRDYQVQQVWPCSGKVSIC